jgi:tryptophan synthase alpha chain
MTHRMTEAMERLEREHRTGIFPYLTVGFPSVEETLALAPALAEAGADLIELGVPFSDPMADGPTVQAATFHALQQGVTPAGCLEVCSTLRKRGLTIPIVFMGYYNPLLSYGLAAFAQDAADAGADGLIVPDLPAEEAGPLKSELQACELSLISMLAPTSTDERIAEACAQADGFVYCVSVTGVTGARDDVPPGAIELLQRVRRHTSLPLAMGFGISERRHVEAVQGRAQAVVVGSALINVIDSAAPAQRLSSAARFIAELAGPSQ